MLQLVLALMAQKQPTLKNNYTKPICDGNNSLSDGSCTNAECSYSSTTNCAPLNCSLDTGECITFAYHPNPILALIGRIFGLA